MPKIVDPEQRRTLIADAVFSVLVAGGFQNVTLASVADRAGLAIGSVRHFLGTREEMIGFAFETIADRIAARVSRRADAVLAQLEHGHPQSEERLKSTVETLCELLPLDAQRREEAIVWIEFETAARTDEPLAAISARAAAQLSGLVETILRAAQDYGGIASSADLRIETARLWALIDGLTLRAALHPDLLTADTAREVLTAHLHQLRESGAAISGGV